MAAPTPSYSSNSNLDNDKVMENSTPLSTLIADATRSQHIIINAHITHLLPLTLAPKEASPDLYVVGLSHVLPIYLTLETLLSRYIHPYNDDSGVDAEVNSEEQISIVLEIRLLRKFFSRELLRSLRRSDALKKDLASLSRFSIFNLPFFMTYPPAPSAILARSRVLREWHSGVEKRVQENPIVLVAYMYTLYLALFSGGRWMRTQFGGSLPIPRESEPKTVLFSQNAGTEACVEAFSFSPQDEKEAHAAETRKYLSFWYLPTPDSSLEQENALKATLHSVMSQISASISNNEKMLIVDECVRIFDTLESLTTEMERTVPRIMIFLATLRWIVALVVVIIAATMWIFMRTLLK